MLWKGEEKCKADPWPGETKGSDLSSGLLCNARGAESLFLPNGGALVDAPDERADTGYNGSTTPLSAEGRPILQAAYWDGGESERVAPAQRRFEHQGHLFAR
jgi:hypothetical protein